MPPSARNEDGRALRLRRRERARIEGLYRRALATAQAQGATVFIARATEGLARLGEETVA